MTWEITIEPVSNGFILKSIDEFQNIEKQVFSTENNELMGVKDLLFAIQELIGYVGNKHEEERIFIEIRKQHIDKI